MDDHRQQVMIHLRREIDQRRINLLETDRAGAPPPLGLMVEIEALLRELMRQRELACQEGDVQDLTPCIVRNDGLYL